MLFKKLKRVWSFNEYVYIPKFKETFPELNSISYDEMCDTWKKLDIVFYTEKETEVPVWIRFTLPFALITILIMYIGIPVNFLITGKWGYSGLGKKNYILNWFRALKLL